MADQRILQIDPTTDDNIWLVGANPGVNNRINLNASLVNFYNSVIVPVFNDFVELDGDQTITGNINIQGSLTSNAVIVDGGLSSQFLKGDGSLDSSAYVVLGETSLTAYRGDRGLIAYSHSQITSGNPHGTTFAQILSKPTTIAGYGITDAYTESEVDTLLAGYLPLTGGILTGPVLSETLISASVINANDGFQFNSVNVFDGNGKINSIFIPALAITETFIAISEVAMLALNAQTGDVAVRTDENKSYILSGTDPSVLGDWQELLTPTDTVLSVDGLIGAVNLETKYLQISNFTWAGIAGKPSPVITLAGDLSGSVTLTSLGNGTLTATVLDDSHNHIIANVDGLQTALDGKLSTSLTSARIFVGNASNIATGVVLSGDASISNAGALTIANNVITNAKLRDSAGGSVIGRSAATSGDPSDIIATADAQVLRVSGGALGFGTIGDASITSLSASKLTNVPSPVITLGGDLSGSVTLTNLGNGTLTATVLDDSHNHIIANVDGLQTALDAKASVASLGNYLLLDASNGPITGPLTVSSTITATGDVRSRGYRATGEFDAIGLTGNGVEISYNNTAGWGRVLSFDRTSGSSAYRPLRLEGSDFTFTTGGDGNIEATLNNTAFNVFVNTNITGSMVATGDVRSRGSYVTGDLVTTGITTPGLELIYLSTGSGFSRVLSFDRGTTLRKELRIDGLDVKIYSGAGTNSWTFTQSGSLYGTKDLVVDGQAYLGADTVNKVRITSDATTSLVELGGTAKSRIRSLDDLSLQTGGNVDRILIEDTLTTVYRGLKLDTIASGDEFTIEGVNGVVFPTIRMVAGSNTGSWTQNLIYMLDSTQARGWRINGYTNLAEMRMGWSASGSTYIDHFIFAGNGSFGLDSTLANASAGNKRLFVDTDNVLKWKDNSGDVYALFNKNSVKETVVTGTQTLLSVVINNVVRLQTSTSNITVTLPPVSECIGRTIVFYGYDTNQIHNNTATIQRNGTDLIFYGNVSGAFTGDTSLVLHTEYKESVTLLGTSFGWVVISATADNYGDIT